MRSSVPLLLALALASHAEDTIPTWKWTKPFGADGSSPAGFVASCTATGTFTARQHRLSDMNVPLAEGGLEPFASAIRFFFGGRPYPGSWDGGEAHGTNRDILSMEWNDVPRAAKDWIAKQQEGDKDAATRWLFGVYKKPVEAEEKVGGTARARETAAPGAEGHLRDEDKIVLFPAGALYEILPLWVAEGSSCEEELMDLYNYGTTPIDEGVVAWPVHHSKPDRDSGSRDITFTIMAQVLSAVEEDEMPEAPEEPPVWNEKPLSNLGEKVVLSTDDAKETSATSVTEPESAADVTSRVTVTETTTVRVNSKDSAESVESDTTANASAATSNAEESATTVKPETPVEELTAQTQEPLCRGGKSRIKKTYPDRLWKDDSSDGKGQKPAVIAEEADKAPLWDDSVDGRTVKDEL